jgi:hypothetical protein
MRAGQGVAAVFDLDQLSAGYGGRQPDRVRQRHQRVGTAVHRGERDSQTPEG